MNNRITTVYKNSIITLAVQLVQILIGFIVRKVFIETLGVEYLGYNSVFSNILQMLNFADLGIGVAITSFLYKPLAENNVQRVATLMTLYKKIYQVVGTIVLVAGIIASFFVGWLIPDATVISLGYLKLLFIINLSGTVATYFLAYKRTLLIADQKSYVINITDGVLFVIFSLVQIFTLRRFHSYIVYLVLNIIKTVISNIILSIRCNKRYGKFENLSSKVYINEYKPKIIQYVKDLFVSRIGAVVFYGTDNVIISVVRGSLLAGFLSNYTMITGYLTTIINQLLASLQATFGNYLNSNKSLQDQRRMTDNYFCANYLIGNFCMICFVFIVQPFVNLYFGQKLLLPFSTAIWLGINLMLSILIQLPSQVFTIYRLFRYDRPIIIVSVILNIVISIILVKYIGIDGALIGTFVTSLIYLFSRFYIIAKKVYDVPFKHYLLKLLHYFFISSINFGIVFFFSKYRYINSWSALFLYGFMVAVSTISISLFILSIIKDIDFFVERMIPIKIRIIFKPVLLGAITLFIIIFCLLYGASPKSIIANNKSGIRQDTYVIEESGLSSKVFHLSIDDTIECFKNISENKYDSIFDDELFSWLKGLHERYGVVVSLYCYYENDNYGLFNVSDSYRQDFEQNSNWLRFGFHTRNANTTYENQDIIEDYKKCIYELERITGKQSIDNVVRLQSYRGSKKNIEAISEIQIQPVKGLLTADDDRQSYYLDKETNDYIYCHDYYFDENLGLTFISTDIRVEQVADVSNKLEEFETYAWNNQLGILEVFTHEWALNLENKEKVEKFCNWAVENGYESKFLEDLIDLI